MEEHAGKGSFEPLLQTLPPFRARLAGTPNRLTGEVGGGGGILRYPNIYGSK